MLGEHSQNPNPALGVGSWAAGQQHWELSASARLHLTHGTFRIRNHAHTQTPPTVSAGGRGRTPVVDGQPDILRAVVQGDVSVLGAQLDVLAAGARHGEGQAHGLELLRRGFVVADVHEPWDEVFVHLSGTNGSLCWAGAVLTPQAPARSPALRHPIGQEVSGQQRKSRQFKGALRQTTESAPVTAAGGSTPAPPPPPVASAPPTAELRSHVYSDGPARSQSCPACVHTPPQQCGAAFCGQHPNHRDRVRALGQVAPLQ